jgi:hypothetical protein
MTSTEEFLGKKHPKLDIFPGQKSLKSPYLDCRLLQVGVHNGVSRKLYLSISPVVEDHQSTYLKKLKIK